MSGMKLWWAIDAAVTRVAKWFLAVSILCLVIMMILATVDIISTKFFNVPIPSTAEFIEDLNIPLVFMAMAYVHLDRGHIAGPIFESRFSPGVNKALKIGGYVLGILISGVIAWRAMSLLQDMIAAGTAKSGTIPFPLWPFALFTLLSFILLAMVYILSIVRLIALPEKAGSETEVINPFS